MTPALVAEFLKTSLLKSNLPRLLPQTELKTEERLEALLSYCQTENKLELPLLLTQDNILRVFKEKVFSSSFFDLVPKQSDLFLHRSLRLWSLSFKDFVKDFGIDDLVGFEKFAKESMKNPGWLELFWEFVKDRMSTEPSTFESVSTKISDWEVVPVQKTGSTTEGSLLQMKDAKTAIFLFPVGLKQEEMSKIVKKLKCSELSPPSLELSWTLAEFSSTLTDFEGLSWVLQALDFSLLGPSDHRTILAYFEDEAPKLSSGSLKRLRALPLFETYNGLRVSLAEGYFRILHAKLPPDGFEATQHGLTFLKHNYSLSKLYKRLGLTEIDELEVYSSFILGTFKDMSDEALLEHLINLQQKLGLLPKEDLQRASIVNSLRSMPVIGPRGSRKCASNFYSHKVEFFKKLLPKDSFLPRNYKDDLFSLCKMIGLQCDVTDQLFLLLAIDLSKGGKAVEEKANYLFNYLVQMAEKWPLHFLQQLSVIKFIPAHHVPAHLQDLNAQFKGGELICFKDSVPSSAQHLVWTSANILPHWAATGNTGLARSLGIDIQPTIEKVLLHCSILCNDLAKRKSTETTANKNSDKLCSTLTIVMKSIYRFLMKDNNNIQIQTALKDVPCIVVEDGRKLVFPHQVSIEMPKDDLRPYLFRLPLELGEFHSFFCKLGATVKPTLKQFSDVLKAIYDASKERKLSPEENRLSVIAIRGFFACLRSTEQANFVGIEALYFLTKDGSLKNMNIVMFSDGPKFADRVKDYDCEDPETFNLDLKCLETLPEKLRPKFLSELVTENLHPDFCESCEPQDPACSLKKHFDLFLSDLKFRQGMARLAKHFCSKSGIKFDEVEMRRKLEQIGSTLIECRPQLQTLLFNSKKKENIPGSERPRNEFVDETGCIFVQHGNETIYELAEILTSFVVHVLGDYIGRDGDRIIQSILNLDDVAKIEQKLNDRDITLESNISYKKVNQGLGDLIDDEFLCFLTQNPCHYFKEGELVGYLQNDVYILARVVSETGSQTATGEFNFGKKYTIDLGQNRVRPFIIKNVKIFSLLMHIYHKGKAKPSLTTFTTVILKSKLIKFDFDMPKNFKLLNETCF